jgi:hypothetical protein
MSHETTQHKEKEEEKKTRELAGPSQKDNKNRKKQVLFILEGNAQKSASKMKKIEDTSWTCRIQQKLQKSEDKSATFQRVSNLYFPYKNQETLVVGREFFFW